MKPTSNTRLPRQYFNKHSSIMRGELTLRLQFCNLKNASKQREAYLEGPIRRIHLISPYQYRILRIVSSQLQSHLHRLCALPTCKLTYVFFASHWSASKTGTDGDEITDKDCFHPHVVIGCDLQKVATKIRQSSLRIVHIMRKLFTHHSMIQVTANATSDTRAFPVLKRNV